MPGMPQRRFCFRVYFSAMLASSADVFLWLQQYGYFAIFPLMIIEGPIVTIIASFLASLGTFSVPWVYALAVAGDITGDIIYYVIGRWGGKPLIERWGRWVGLTKERMTAAEQYFNRHSGKALVIGKLTHGVGMWVLMGAGAARTPFWPFVWFNMIGTIPKALLFVVIGYFFGQAYASIGGYINDVSIVLGLIVLVVGGGYVLHRRLKKPSASDLR